MNLVASSLVAIALICTPFSSALSRGTDPLSKEDVKRRAKYKEVYRFNVRGLIEATLTKSKDLAKKGGIPTSANTTVLQNLRPGIEWTESAASTKTIINPRWRARRGVRAQISAKVLGYTLRGTNAFVEIWQPALVRRQL